MEQALFKIRACGEVRGSHWHPIYLFQEQGGRALMQWMTLLNHERIRLTGYYNQRRPVNLCAVR